MRIGTRLRQFGDVALRPIQFGLYWLSGFVPRDADRWVFGTWSGHRYADNAAALFEHLAAHPVDGITTTWITRRRSIRDAVRAMGGTAHLAWSPSGVWATMRAGVHIYDSVPKDVNFWLSRGARLVLLRHGIGVKRIERGIDARDHRLFKLFHGTRRQRFFYGILLPSHLVIPDLVLACSEEHARQGELYFGVTREAIEITGFPRHDRFAELPAADRTQVPCVGEPVPSDRPLFLFLPTFREGPAHHIFDWDELAQAAAAAGIVIGVKLHYVDAVRGVTGLDRIHQSSHLRLIDPTIDPAEWYAHADGMITDFSSAAFDFLLVRRPIVYFVPDLAEFQVARPLMVDLAEVAAGPICTDGHALGEALREAVHWEGSDRHVELVARFYAHPPGGACERVISAIRARTRLREDLPTREPATSEPD